MAKQSGLGDNLYVDGYDLSGDVGAVQTLTQSQGQQDQTSLDKSAMERRGLLLDGKIAFNNFFNDEEGYPAGAFTVLKQPPSADRIVTFCHKTTLGNPAACMVAKQSSYSLARAADGSILGTFDAEANGYGLVWGVQLTAGKVTHASAANGTGLYSGVAADSTAGLTAYGHFFAIGSGTPTVKLQESDDDGATDAYADVAGGTFGVVTAPTAARIATAPDLSVERWLRVKSTGTFTGLVFAVTVIRG